MADFIQLAPGETDLGKIVAAIRALIERAPATEDAAGAATPTSTQIISGAGLTGGGNLSADRTLAVGAGTGITVNADDVALANMAQATLKGRASGAGTGAPGDRTGSEVRTIAGLEYGLQTIWVPAVGMFPFTSGAAAGPAGQSTYSSGNFAAVTADFDQTTIESVVFQVSMPKSWDKGGISFVPYWTATAGTGTVKFLMFAVAISNDDPTNGTLTTSADSTDTLIATNDLHVGPTSGALTPDGTPANDDLILFNFLRDTSNDTLSADARLIGVKLLYTVNAGNDS